MDWRKKESNTYLKDDEDLGLKRTVCLFRIFSQHMVTVHHSMMTAKKAQLDLATLDI